MSYIEVTFKKLFKNQNKDLNTLKNLQQKDFKFYKNISFIFSKKKKF